MATEAVKRLLGALECAGMEPRRSGDGWTAPCPAHDDSTPSLSIGTGTDGRALVHCHAGCDPKLILETLGLQMRDLMPHDSLDTDTTHACANTKGVLSVSRPSTPENHHLSTGVFDSPDAAIAALEKKMGPHAKTWAYQDCNGSALTHVVRWNLPDGKQVRPITRDGDVWRIGAPASPRPLYRLSDLTSAARVYVTEGEPAADAVRDLGLAATTSLGGSNASAKSDWSPLAGKEVVILPDNDSAGDAYADSVAKILSRLDPRPIVRIVALPGLPVAGDAVDFIESNPGKDRDHVLSDIETLAKQSAPLHPDACAIAARMPFPVAALPAPMRQLVDEGAMAIGCAPSFIALPLLSAGAAAIGGTHAIELKAGWREPCIIWTAIVGDSGSMKTPAFKLVMDPIRAIQSEILHEFADERAAWEQECNRHEIEMTKWKNAAKRGSSTEMPAKPEEPMPTRYIVSDTTTEALGPILSSNPRGVLLARDEISGWIASFDKYSRGAGGADAAHWLSMHNAEPISVDRKGGPLINVPSAILSVTGGIQPGTLRECLGQRHLENGLAARLLVAVPPKRPKRWTDSEIPPTTLAAITKLFRSLYSLTPADISEQGWQPHVIRLDADARSIWVEFYNEHADQQARLTGATAAAFSKLEGYAARLALLIHVVRREAGVDPPDQADRIDRASLEAAITLVKWFCSEARRVYSMLHESEAECARRKLVDWISGNGGSTTARDLQRGLAHVSSAKQATELLDDLAKRGVGEWSHPPPGTKGGHPRKIFRLFSGVVDESASNQ